MIFEWTDWQFEVPANKIYSLPNNIVEIIRYGFRLMIAVDSGNWIVLENDTQHNIFRDFQNRLDVSEVLAKYPDAVAEIHYVIVQLEGRHFEFKYTPEDCEENFSLRIYLTNKCNLRCRHCFMYADKRFDNELTTDEVEQLIGNCNRYGAEKLILTGGEVLMSPAFPVALRTAHALGMYTQVLSNGTLWTEKSIAELSTMIDEIQFSIDGFNENINAEIRGKNTFDKILAVVDAFIDKGVFVSIVMTPLYEHVERYRDGYIRFGQSLVNKYPEDKFLIMFTGELLDGRNIKAVADKNARYKKTIATICNAIYENNELTAFILDHHYNRIFRNCGYGNLTVNSIGDFYFCGRVFDVRKYGNIREMPFEEVMKMRRRARSLSQIDNMSGCADCELKYVCGGGCRIVNFPSVTQLPQLECESLKPFAAQTCNSDFKENLYKLMINANDFLMWKQEDN